MLQERLVNCPSKSATVRAVRATNSPAYAVSSSLLQQSAENPSAVSRGSSSRRLTALIHIPCHIRECQGCSSSQSSCYSATWYARPVMPLLLLRIAVVSLHEFYAELHRQKASELGPHTATPSAAACSDINFRQPFTPRKRACSPSPFPLGRAEVQRSWRRPFQRHQRPPRRTGTGGCSRRRSSWVLMNSGVKQVLLEGCEARIENGAV